MPLVGAKSFVLAAGALLAGACGDQVVPHEPATGPDAAALYWALTADDGAVTMSTAAPYDTFRVTVTPRDAKGIPIEGLGPVTLTSATASVVSVDADGVLHAHTPGFSQITATLVADDTRHETTFFVKVTEDAAPPTPVSLSIAPPPSDSARLPMFGPLLLSISREGLLGTFDGKLVPAVVLDVEDQPIADAIVDVRTDTTVVDAIGLPLAPVVFLQGAKPGKALVTAVATVYGVRLTDTFEYTVTTPIIAGVNIVPRVVKLGEPPRSVFEPRSVVVSPGATVLWLNLSGEPVDVVFDDPGAALEHGPVVSCTGEGRVDVGGAGDIPAFGVPVDPTNNALSADNCRTRQFMQPGVYTYRSPTTGATGSVVVDDGVVDP